MKKFLSKIMVFLILLTIIYIITAQTFRYLDLQVKGESGRMRYIHNELIADSINKAHRLCRNLDNNVEFHHAGIMQLLRM